MKYKAIFERNADRLVNANTIYEGRSRQDLCANLFAGSG